MPRIAVVDGCIIYVYKEAGGRHHLPHIHVTGAGWQATVNAVTGEVMGGNIPRNKRKSIHDFLRRRGGEVLEAINLVNAGGNPKMIEG